MSKSTEKVDGVKIFFHIYTASVNSHHLVRNGRVCSVKFEIRIPSLCATRWFCKSRIVSAIKDDRQKIMNALEDILDHGKIWDEATLSETDNLLSKLNDFTFMFFIKCFYVILSQAEKLFDILQCRKLDVK